MMRTYSRKSHLKRFLKRKSFKNRTFRDTKELIQVFNELEPVPTKVNLYLERWIEFKVHQGDWVNKCKETLLNTKIDSSSLGSFKFKFGEEEGLKRFNDKKLKTTMDLGRFVELYGEELGTKKFKERNKKSGMSHDDFVKKYGEQKANEIKQSKSQSKEACIQRHGEEEGLKQFNKNCKFNSYKTTKEYYKEKYGELGLQKYQSFKENDLFFGDDTSPNQVSYWIKQGLTKEQATQKVSEVQLRFSKEICITKYGQVKGTEIWQARQDKWQQTLNSKTPEEIERMNQLKSTGRMAQYFAGNPEAKKVPGVLYYLRFFSDDIEFWKIGITSYSVYERFNPNSMKAHNGLEYEILNERDDLKFGECFKEEQRILKQYSDNRVTVNYNGFKSTECFNKDILSKV